MKNEVRYNVYCMSCGQVWVPGVLTHLWWKAQKRAQEGFLDALPVSSHECGCKPERVHPDAPFRVVGYDDMCRDFDIPFYSIVPALRQYLELARDGMNIVFFIGGSEKLQERLKELEWA